jgi:DNA recombination protein RmuC
VVDSKVSLLGYGRFVNASDDAERAAGLREHLASVRAHLKGLSDKKYQGLYGQSLDFVLMFVPVEPAFSAAVTHDQHLFMEAWSKNVLLVSPSTLLFVVRTVAHLWRQEAQSKNAQDIAKRGAELYDKLHGFVQDFEMVGTRLGLAQDAFVQAKKKLVEGRGNVIRQAEQLRALGVKPTKTLPASLVEQAHLGEERDELGLPPRPRGTASTAFGATGRGRTAQLAPRFPGALPGPQPGVTRTSLRSASAESGAPRSGYSTPRLVDGVKLPL